MGPVKILRSTKNLDEKIAVDETVQTRVENAIGAAKTWVTHALQTVRKGPVLMSSAEKDTWKSCFLADADFINLSITERVLQKTYLGMCAAHTVKLAAGDYVRRKFGAFGGPKGSIHLAADIFTKEYMLEPRVWSYVHEASHKFADTSDAGDGAFKSHSVIAYMDRGKVLLDDKLEYRKDKNPGPWPSTLSARNALNNADSYAGFVVALWLRSHNRAPLS